MAVTKAAPKLSTANKAIQTLQSYLMVFQSVMDDVEDATLDTNLVAFFVTSLAAR
jgi:DNA integrity scanning protein DisA with diadenylate cyclase activity